MPPKSEKLIAAELKTLSSVYSDLWQDLRELNARTKAAARAREDEAENKNVLEEERVYQQDKITKKYGAKLQAQLDDFYKGPGKNSTLAEKSAWLNRNFVAAALSLNPDYAEDNRCSEIRQLWASRRNPGFVAKIFFSKFAPGSIYLGSGKPLENPEADWNAYMETDTNAAADQYDANEIRNAKAAIAEHSGRAALSLFDRDKDKFGLCMAKLENAKTLSNSDEYKLIISTLRRFSKQEPVPGKDAEKLTPEQNHAVKLLTLKDMIDKYIGHKAQDGVKKNTYHKLAAIEELNKFVTERISELNIPEFKYCGVRYAPREKAVDAPTRNLENAERLHGRNADVDTKECANTLDCMDRIIGRAQDQNKKQELKEIKGGFLAYPSTAGPDRVTKEQDAPAKAKEVKQAAANTAVNKKLQAAAKKALSDGEKLMSMSQKTHDLFESASGISHFFTFMDNNENMYCYAKRHNLTVDLEWDNKNVRWPISDVASAMKKAAKKAADMLPKKSDRGDTHDLCEPLDDGFSAIERSVIADLKKRAPEIKTLLEKDLTDEELIKKWPDMQLDHACYAAYTRTEQFKTFNEKFERLEERMKALADPVKVKEQKEFGAPLIGGH